MKQNLTTSVRDSSHNVNVTTQSKLKGKLCVCQNHLVESFVVCFDNPNTHTNYPHHIAKQIAFLPTTFHRPAAPLPKATIPTMGNKVVKQHFETAQKTGVLQITQQRLQEFPPHLRDFPNVLRTLDLSENRFVTLPETLGHFTLLKHLNVNANRLVELPEVLGLLVKLETLSAINNLIVRVPRGLAQLANLKKVLLSNNQLAEFPTQLCGLRHLDLVDLSRNKLTALPPEVRTLHVVELNVNQNQLARLAEELAECPRLRVLRLEENCLPVQEIHERILKESKICNLYVDGNMFQSKHFVECRGYDEYMERYTAVKKKMF